MASPAEIGARFRRARMFLDLDQEAVGQKMRERLGYGSKDTVARIEKGQRMARPTEIAFMEDLAGRPLSSFVPAMHEPKEVVTVGGRTVPVTADALIDTLVQLDALRSKMEALLSPDEWVALERARGAAEAEADRLELEGSERGGEGSPAAEDGH